jgi:hypothetical protein
MSEVTTGDRGFVRVGHDSYDFSVELTFDLSGVSVALAAKANLHAGTKIPAVAGL